MARCAALNGVDISQPLINTDDFGPFGIADQLIGIAVARIDDLLERLT